MNIKWICKILIDWGKFIFGLGIDLIDVENITFNDDTFLEFI